jgi:RNA polymerase I-specific transcription initiation factor RRN3
MRNSILQKLLNKQKQEKFGDVIVNDRWDELIPNIINGVSKFEDAIVPIQEQGKIMVIFEYITTTQDPSQQILGLLGKIIPMLNQSEDIEHAAGLLRDMVLRSGTQAGPVIDLIVRNFLKQDEPHFSNCINQLIDASPNNINPISSSISKFFPQTSFDGTEQVNYLKSTLNVCAYCKDVALSVLNRVFQHLIGLDCELMINNKSGSANALEIDEDVAIILTPQITLVLDFIESSPPELFTLLLQLFDLYLIDLPSSTTVQFIFFIAASYEQNQYETFVGYLLHKMIDNGVCTRTRGNAAFYLATLIARAKFIDDHFAAAALTYVANFASCYLTHVRTNSPQMLTRNIQSHTIFYDALQCIAYVCCWRYESWKQIGIDPQEKWNLSELFVNELEGLTAIDKNTAEMFGSLGIVEYDPDEFIIDRIDVWFPFDPCPFEEVKARVDPIYKEWGEESEPADIDSMLDQSLSKICSSRGISLDDMFKNM